MNPYTIAFSRANPTPRPPPPYRRREVGATNSLPAVTLGRRSRQPSAGDADDECYIPQLLRHSCRVPTPVPPPPPPAPAPPRCTRFHGASATLPANYNTDSTFFPFYPSHGSSSTLRAAGNAGSYATFYPTPGQPGANKAPWNAAAVADCLHRSPIAVVDAATRSRRPRTGREGVRRAPSGVAASLRHRPLLLPVSASASRMSVGSDSRQRGHQRLRRLPPPSSSPHPPRPEMWGSLGLPNPADSIDNPAREDKPKKKSKDKKKGKEGKKSIDSRTLRRRPRPWPPPTASTSSIAMLWSPKLKTAEQNAKGGQSKKKIVNYVFLKEDGIPFPGYELRPSVIANYEGDGDDYNLFYFLIKRQPLFFLLLRRLTAVPRCLK